MQGTILATIISARERAEWRTNMSHHTPGPWTSKIHHYSNCEVYDESGDMIATVHPTDGVTGGIGPMVANTHLVAAAPELLEALYAALPLLEDAAEFMKADFKPGYLSKLVKDARAAIAKAEGEV